MNDLERAVETDTRELVRRIDARIERLERRVAASLALLMMAKSQRARLAPGPALPLRPRLPLLPATVRGAA